MKIRPFGAELLHGGGRTIRRTDRQTDMTKLIVAIRNLGKALKNSKELRVQVNHFSHGENEGKE
jgi:hypothetical protein